MLYGERGLIAIEVKRTAKPSSSDLRSPRHFATDYPKAKLILVHGGKHRTHDGAVALWPLDDFLHAPPEILGA